MTISLYESKWNKLNFNKLQYFDNKISGIQLNISGFAPKCIGFFRLNNHPKIHLKFHTVINLLYEKTWRYKGGIKKMTNNTTSKTTRTKHIQWSKKKSPVPAYISQLIQHYKGCETYHDFLDRGLLLSRKLLNQGFIVVKLVPLLEQERITFLEHASSP